jgi:hypothetical protein
MHRLIDGWVGDLYRASVEDFARRGKNETRCSGSGQMDSRDLAKMLLASGGHLSLAYGIFFQTLPDRFYAAELEPLRYHRNSASL